MGMNFKYKVINIMGIHNITQDSYIDLEEKKKMKTKILESEEEKSGEENKNNMVLDKAKEDTFIDRGNY